MGVPKSDHVSNNWELQVAQSGSYLSAREVPTLAKYLLGEVRPLHGVGAWAAAFARKRAREEGDLADWRGGGVRVLLFPCGRMNGWLKRGDG